jgi:hypothetical protein
LPARSDRFKLAYVAIAEDVDGDLQNPRPCGAAVLSWPDDYWLGFSLTFARPREQQDSTAGKDPGSESAEVVRLFTPA